MTPGLPNPASIQNYFGLQHPRFQSPVMPMILPITLTATTALTPTQLMQGMINMNAAGATTLTLPAAAYLAAAIQGCMVGTSFQFLVRCTGAGTVTIAVGTGGTISGTNNVTTTNTREYLV